MVVLVQRVSPNVMHAAACPSQAAQALCLAGWESGVASSATEVARVASPACLPPEIPWPAPRGVLRAAVGRSSDSWTRKQCFLLDRCFPVRVHQCVSRLRFHLPLRGSAGMGSCEPHRLPFSSGGANRRNRQPQHSVVYVVRQRDIWTFSHSKTEPAQALECSRRGSTQAWRG